MVSICLAVSTCYVRDEDPLRLLSSALGVHAAPILPLVSRRHADPDAGCENFGKIGPDIVSEVTSWPSGTIGNLPNLNLRSSLKCPPLPHNLAPPISARPHPRQQEGTSC